MMKARRLGLLTLLALALVGAAACKFYETDKANKLVEAANASITEANSKWQSGTSKLDQMQNDALKVEDEDEAGLAKVRGDAKAVIADLEKARDGFTDGGNKFLEAAKMKVPDKLKEYWEAKGQEMKKRGEQATALLADPQALLDSQNREDYKTKAVEAEKKFQTIKKEADDLETKANKIYEDNKALFKQS
jgi:hypothetical protein